jgi:hypothetical protein
MNALAVVTTGGRRGVDLGRINPLCEATYHGTNTARTRGKCICPHAREAHRLYQKRMREGRLAPVLLDATGTRRRVQGMWALGHPSTTIIKASGGKLDRQQVVRFCQQKRITPGHRDLIAEAYRKLIVCPGTSVRTRDRALAAGYALPVQWGANIDDPAAVPDALEPEPDIGEVDEFAIGLALSGQPVPLTDQELIAAVRIGTARDLGPWTLAPLLGLDPRVVARLAAGDVPPRLASIARRRTAHLGRAA